MDIRKIVSTYPLATVLTVAIVLRALAVIFSKGYMASDDHFETVSIAYNWLRNGGPLNSDGFLTWASHAPEEIGRFPLYNLFVYGVVKVCNMVGMESLDTIMYPMRAVNAALSLISVWAVFKITHIVTASQKWSFVAGMVMAAHFGMSYLSVRNLIEVAGGHFWILAILAYYLFVRDKNQKWLIIAGLLTGLAWMLRFQIAFAVIPVPFILWYENKSLKPAMIFSGSVLGMILLSGFIDLLFLNKFLASTLNHLGQGMGEGKLYNTIHLIYPAVILSFFIPPISLLVFYLAFRKRFWGNHLMITITSFSFIFFHSFVANRQERFMIPILPVLAVIAILVLWHHKKENGILFNNKKFKYSFFGFAFLINFILFFPFTLNYSHKGLIDPIVWLENNQDETPTVFFLSPDKNRLIPIDYGGLELIDSCVAYNWADLDSDLFRAKDFDYFVLFPPREELLESHKDSIIKRFGNIELTHHSAPSAIDYILHKLNPRHNSTNEAWVFKSVK